MVGQNTKLQPARRENAWQILVFVTRTEYDDVWTHTGTRLTKSNSKIVHNFHEEFTFHLWWIADTFWLTIRHCVKKISYSHQSMCRVSKWKQHKLILWPAPPTRPEHIRWTPSHGGVGLFSVTAALHWDSATFCLNAWAVLLQSPTQLPSSSHASLWPLSLGKWQVTHCGQWALSEDVLYISEMEYFTQG